MHISYARLRCYLPLTLILWLLLLWPTGANAQDSITWQISVGYGEVVKSGVWTPVTITIANDGPDVSGTLQVRTPNNANTVYSQPVDLPHGANKRIVLPVVSDMEGWGNGTYNVQLRSGNATIKQERVRVRHVNGDELVIGVLSEDSAALPQLADLGRGGPGRAALARLLPADLPERSEYLQSFDTLFIHAVDTSQISEAQREALRLWVINGGRLVVGGQQQTTSGLADLLPATVGGDGGTSSIVALETATGWRASDRSFSTPIIQLEPNTGTDVVRGDNDAPLLVQQMLGSGTVVLTAFDLNALSEAGNVADLWQRVLFFSWQQPVLAALQQNWFALQNVLDLPSLALPSVFTLLLFLLLYIIAVGPLNYLVLQRMGRREWAYVSVPVLVLLFSGGAYAWGTVDRGGETINTQLSFVRVLPEAPRGQATTYMLFFSPSRRSYDLSVPADTWLTSGEPPWNQQGGTLEISESGNRQHIADLLIDVGGVRPVIATSLVDAPLVEAVLRTVDGEQQLVLRNRSNQSVEDLGLVRADGRAQSIGTLAAGEERTVELSLRIGSLDQIRTASSGAIQRDAVLRDLAGAFIVWGDDAAMNGVFFGGPFGAGPPPEFDPMTGEPLPEVVAEPTVDPQGAAPHGIGVRDRANQRLYLLGWQQRATVDVTLDGVLSSGAGETLYFWHVQEEE